jgi:hypothetical protein
MKSLLHASYARLPIVKRPVLETLLAGYFRIAHTIPLIRNAINRADDEEDARFWRQAFEDERGHDDVYWQDLMETFGAEFPDHAGRYEPCPATIDLLAWADESNLHSALYRAYLEECLASAPEEAIAELSRYLPRSMAIHKEADPEHAAQTLAYLSRFDCDWAGKIAFIERCLSAEMRHVGLPQ